MRSRLFAASPKAHHRLRRRRACRSHAEKDRPKRALVIARQNFVLLLREKEPRLLRVVEIGQRRVR